MVCRELTKTHEEVRRGTLAELAGWAAGGLLGEITLVVGGDPGRTPAHPGGGRRPRSPAGPATASRRSEAIAAVARESGLRRREVYDAVVAARQPGPASLDPQAGPPRG